MHLNFTILEKNALAILTVNQRLGSIFHGRYEKKKYVVKLVCQFSSVPLIPFHCKAKASLLIFLLCKKGQTAY